MATLSHADAGLTLETFSGDGLVVGDIVQTRDVLITAGVAYKRGDALTVNPSNNIASHVLSGNPTLNVIMAFDLTSAEATTRATSGLTLPAYSQGEFDVSKVTITGLVPSASQINYMRGTGGASNIHLRRVL